MKVFSSIIILLATIFVAFLFFYISYIEWNVNKKDFKDFSSDILLFRDALTPELLNSFTIKKEKIPKEITELNIELFIEALKKANKGGYSHPVYERHLFFFEKKEGIHFVIEIDVGRDGNRKFSNVKISIYDDEKLLDGLEFQSNELEKWSEDVGLLN